MRKRLGTKRTSAFLGALVGTIAGTALQASEAFTAGFVPSEPFYWTVLETAACAAAGAALFAAVVWIYGRKFRV